ncbi:acetylcholinesterase-like [Anopheles albimanus]|uniref:acetylcholinesterase-like n=1 Tax=Anopheles albimanus TaxID=7167 RepID=UPI00164097CB|nr:acetylcholinesterase-like [Anopheles albimanus]
MAEERKVTVTLPAGTIIGQKLALPNGDDCFAFKGIPYAKPPTGELRFKSPVPLAAFASDPLECLTEGPCSYAEETRFPMPFVDNKSEDCLYLNVFSPNLQPDQPVPVLIWIHGGGFFAGSGHSAQYDPEYLVQQGVTVVTINYRLGPLGFLALPSVGINGNMGLKDQRMSFRWVRDNIERFGGDPNNVTIFGESAGGASVHLHYLSEGSRKYFHKAIAQSGTAFNEWVWQREPERRARNLARLLGASESDSDEVVLATLMGASAEKMTTLQYQAMTEYEQSWLLCFPFTPIIEPDGGSEDAILTEHPSEAAKRSFQKEIPLMVGTTQEEAIGLWSFVGEKLPMFQNDPGRLLPTTLNVRDDQQARQRAIEQTMSYFLQDRPISTETIADIIPILSDNFNTYAAYLAAELHARYQSAPLYCFVFSYVGELSVFRKHLNIPPEQTAASHGDDVYYLFSSNLMNTQSIDEGSDAAKFRAFCCRVWADFARTGTPGSTVEQWNTVPRMSGTDTATRFQLPALELKSTTPLDNAMIEDCFAERFQFWNGLFEQFNGSHLLPKVDTVRSCIDQQSQLQHAIVAGLLHDRIWGRWAIYTLRVSSQTEFVSNKTPIYSIMFSNHSTILWNRSKKIIPELVRKISGQSRIHVELNGGTVSGVVEKLPDGNDFCAFRGIPYAKAPIGRNRFLAAEPLDRFPVPVLDCSTERDTSVARNPFNQKWQGSEDCLHLNVYTPQRHLKGDLLPVMVFIHGGAFKYGNGNSDCYSPEYLLEQNVIVVTLNYRLGPLGFLHLPSQGVEGNAALKDQLLALRWVSENIGRFNGDPGNVTLFGESSGGVLVHLHLLSPASQPYFHKAICQSGHSLTEFGLPNDTLGNSRRLARQVNPLAESDAEMLESLRHASPRTLAEMDQRVLTETERDRGLPIPFRPVVDADTTHPILPLHPAVAMRTKNHIPDIPVMMGYNVCDGASVTRRLFKNPELYRAGMQRMIPRSINIDLRSPAARQLANELEQLYFGTAGYSPNRKAECTDLVTDYAYAISSQIAAELHARYQHRSPLFFYRFDFDGALNLYKKYLAFDVPGAYHADELCYLFQ